MFDPINIVRRNTMLVIIGAKMVKAVYPLLADKQLKLRMKKND